MPNILLNYKIQLTEYYTLKNNKYCAIYNKYF